MTRKLNLDLKPLTIQSNGFVADIIRTDRKKTVSFKVIEGKVSIVVPKSLATSEISALLKQKQRWILEKLKHQNDRVGTAPKSFATGELFSYLGNEVTLKIKSGAYPKIQFYQQSFVVTVRDISANNAAAIKQMLIKWYQQQAQKILMEKTKKYAKTIGVKPSKITVKTYKARWGSCSSRAEIQYNWKIIMAPEYIIDYLVVHELCHILHHNHSSLFWATVGKFHPGYRDCKAWLKENGKRLEI